MRLVAWWALLSSAVCPLVLIAGWATAAQLEGPRYDPVSQTISVLAAGNSSGYWALTTTLIIVGICHLVTAWGLRAARPAGRLALAGGGASAILLSQVPAPASGGSLPHGWVVGVGYTLLATWPVLARVRGENVPWGLRPATAYTATGVMWLGALWFLIALLTHSGVGVSERVVTSGQALWPGAVVVSCLRPPDPRTRPKR